MWLTSNLNWLVYPAVGFLTVIIRSLPRWCSRRGALSFLHHDAWFHLLYAEEIAQNKHRIPRCIRQFLLAKETVYPPLMHWLWSFLPRSWRHRLEPCWGGLCDGVIAIALLTATGLYIPGGTIRIGLWAVALFWITPAMTGTGWGPRTLHGTPRAWGQMLFTLATFFFLLFSATGAFNWFALAAGIGSLIFLSSMFSIQAFVFLYLLVAIFLWSWTPVLLVLTSFVISLLWFRGRVLKIMRKQIRILKVMRRSLARNEFDCTVIQHRNRWRDFRLWPRDLIRNPMAAYHLATQQNTWLILLTQMPLVPAWVFLCGPSDGIAGDPGFIAGLFIWSALALFILTSFRRGLFLGEAERYVEHVVPLTCLTLSMTLTTPESLPMHVLTGVASLSLIFSILNIVLFFHKERSDLPRQARIQKTLNWILACTNGQRFLVLPRSQMNLLIPYFTAGSVLYGNWDSQSPPEVLALRNPFSVEFARYQEKLLARFGIHYLVTETYPRNYLDIQKLFETYLPVFQNTEITVLAQPFPVQQMAAPPRYHPLLT